MNKRTLATLKEKTGYDFIPEFKFDEKRKWRFDFALPEAGDCPVKIAVEIEGGIFTRGRHTRPLGYLNDCIKYNEAAEHGWTVLRYSTQQMNEGPTYQQINRMINQRKDQWNERTNR